MTAIAEPQRTRTAGLLRDKIIIITGAGSGIGAASARLFGHEGATVVLAGPHQPELEEVTASVVDAGGQADWVRADISAPDDVERLVAGTVQRHGRLDGAFNNAGIGQGGALLGDLDADRFDDVLSVNVKGLWLCMRAEIAAMTAGGGGSIVNASSIAGLRGRPGLATYAASKHAVVGLTRSGALDYGQAGIRVNALAPGTVQTPMTAEWMKQQPELAGRLLAATPLGRTARPDEIAEAAAWLLSDRASYVSGAVLTIDGGMTA